MTVSTALVPTDRPARYLKQLVSQLGHKAVTQHSSDDQGTVMLSRGSCLLTATPYGLSLVATAVDAERLAQVQEVVAQHLVRFAGQEEVSVDWSEPTAGEDLEFISPVVNDYLLAHCTPADEVLRELAVTTREREASGNVAQMQVSHDEGVLLTMLTRLVDARF